MSDWDESIPNDVISRLQALFERRLHAARNATNSNDFKAELVGFGWWFTSGKFEEKWALAMLFSVLQISKKVADDMNLVKRLAKLAPEYPEECVNCLRLMVEGDRDHWLLVGVEKQTEELLHSALYSDTARESARRLIEDLIARGHFGFRRLLKATPKE